MRATICNLIMYNLLINKLVDKYMDLKKGALVGGGVLAGLFAGANAGRIIKGLTGGFITVLLAFALIIFTVTGIDENSKEVSKLKLQSVSDVDDKRGLVMVYGGITGTNKSSIEIMKCTNDTCTTKEIALSKDNLLYSSVTVQRFEVVRKVEKAEGTENSNKETVIYSHEWVTKDSKESWADLELDGIKLEPTDAKIKIDFEQITIDNVPLSQPSSFATYNRTPKEDEPAFGSTRAVVKYLEEENREYIVVGESRSDGITSGDLYIITDKSETELVETLKGEETILRWGLRFLAFLMLSAGFTGMLSPVLTFTDIVPLVGPAARNLAGFISSVLAGIILLATVFLLNYWWIIGLLLVAGVAGFIYISGKSGEAKISV